VDRIIILVIETHIKSGVATRTAYIQELQELTISDKSEKLALLYCCNKQQKKYLSETWSCRTVKLKVSTIGARQDSLRDCWRERQKHNFGHTGGKRRKVREVMDCFVSTNRT
jgi:hypothetical protein